MTVGTKNRDVAKVGAYRQLFNFKVPPVVDEMNDMVPDPMDFAVRPSATVMLVSCTRRSDGMDTDICRVAPLSMGIQQCLHLLPCGLLKSLTRKLEILTSSVSLSLSLSLGSWFAAMRLVAVLRVAHAQEFLAHSYTHNLKPFRTYSYRLSHIVCCTKNTNEKSNDYL